MHSSTIHCKDDRRRAAVRRRQDLNGLDYLDVSSDQLMLTVYFLGKAPAQLLRGPDERTAEYQKRMSEYVRIEGGRRIREIRAIEVSVHQALDPRTGDVDPELDDWMDVRLDKYGDFSTYTLRMTGVEAIDPRYDHIDFSFKVDCPSDLDCLPADTCPPPRLEEPDINYLAKDYASFRQLMLDRLALLMPEWKEQHVPDLGIALVETLAYVGDHLSYYQDAVATEAYLDTARQRISVRRHARLVDYRMHEGCNARAWVCIETADSFTGDNALDPRKVYFITRNQDDPQARGTVLTAEALQQVEDRRYEIFEPVTTNRISLYQAHSEIHFYTWEERECCLPRGATSATLQDGEAVRPTPVDLEDLSRAPVAALPSMRTASPTGQAVEYERRLHLEAGDVLIFEEVIGPQTGSAADADPLHRHAVRLTKVTRTEDPLNSRPLIEIEWSQEDALPFPLCISALTDTAHGCHYNENVSVARGNVLLVDHGFTWPSEDLGIVPCAHTQAECDCEDHLSEISFLPGRYRPQLSRTLLTFRQPLPADDLQRGRIVSAAQLIRQEMRLALPQVTELASAPAAPATDCEHLQPLFRLADLIDVRRLVVSLRDDSNPMGLALRARLSKELLDQLGQAPADDLPPPLHQALLSELQHMLLAWWPQFDLLSSGADDPHFVVEVDNDGYAHLRFGRGELGRMPEAGSAFFATCRTGNGIAGNVGAEAITHLVLRNTTLSGILRVRNPLPAQGGTEPETMAEVKLLAPFAFRSEMQRAITAGDYAQLAQSHFSGQVQQGAAALVWTGSWYEAQVAVDPLNIQEAGDDLLDAIENRLYSYRRIGHDLSVSPAQYVPLDIALEVCVKPGYLPGHIKAALLDAFSNRVLRDGRLGFFHPDRLTFGGSIYLSELIAAAQAVAGVESVMVKKLQRLNEGDGGELASGILQLGPLEVARLENDPSFPEHGRFVLEVGGER
jgi:hypothetical protein